MTRYRPHQMPTAPAATRYALLQPETWLAFLTVWAFAANEWLGPVFLGLSLLLWTIYCLQNPTFMFKSLSTTGIFAWLVPLLALLSILWSFDPLATGRAAIQLALTIALALMTANLVTPKRFITSVWVTMGIILFMSIIINNQYYDAMTGRTTMAGVFTNKNTLSSCSAIFALASAAICFSRGVSAPFRVVAFLGIGAGVVMCVLARSVAVIGAMMLALAALTVIVSAILVPRRMQSGYMSMALVVGLGMGTILLLSTLAFSEELLALVGKDSTLTGRTTLWFYADRLTQEQPLLGVGFQAFWRQGFSPAEQIWKVMRIQGRYGFNFHNLYYEILSQLGYIGVALCVVVITYAVVVTVTWVRRNPDASSGFFVAIFLMILITQWQAASLFVPFDPSTYFFMTSVAYAAGWCRHEAGLRQAVVSRNLLPASNDRLRAA